MQNNINTNRKPTMSNEQLVLELTNQYKDYIARNDVTMHDMKSIISELIMTFRFAPEITKESVFKDLDELIGLLSKKGE